MNVLPLVAQSLLAALEMFWSILWALVLGFALSGMIMAFVPKKRISALLGKPGPRELAWAILLGAASSSCSYAAAAMARSLFRKGAHIISAFAFLIASTNLVLELSLVLWLLMGWQFVVAEFVGGVLVVAIMAVLMHLFRLAPLFLREAEGAGAPEQLHDPRTLEGWKAAARAFVSEWKMIGKDVAIGCVISGALMTLVPTRVWQALFLSSSVGGVGKAIENAFVGPLVSVLSFVCSVGNIPLAAALYHGGIGFGGAVSFIYADLIIIPLLLVYRQYFGVKAALAMFGVFYVSMALGGLLVELLFQALGWIPVAQTGGMSHERLAGSPHTLLLNLGAIAVAIALAKLAKGQPSKSCCH